MKISEVIINETIQLDEGVVDTIKQKLNGVLAKIRQAYPNFDAVLNQVKTYQQEIRAIASQLQSGTKPSKDELIAMVKPLATRVAGEMKTMNEGKYDPENQPTTLYTAGDYSKARKSTKTVTTNNKKSEISKETKEFLILILMPLYGLLSLILSLRNESFVQFFVMVFGALLVLIFLAVGESTERNKWIQVKNFITDIAKTPDVKNAYTFHKLSQYPYHKLSYKDNTRLEYLQRMGFKRGSYENELEKIMNAIESRFGVSKEAFKQSNYYKFMIDAIEKQL
jgi:hypothetical protein